MTTAPNIEKPTDKPNLTALKAELDELVTNASYYYSRAGLYYDTRYCLWEGQSDDGRKNTADLGEDPFPWDGASDTRVRLADKIIKERKRFRKLAFWGKRLVARPIGQQNAKWAATANPLLKWLLYVANVRMIKRELNLAWSYQDCYGAVVMGTFWHRETRSKPQVVKLDDLVQLVQQTQSPELAALADSLQDPLRDEANILFLQKFFPDSSTGELRKFLAELRLTGEASLDVPYISKNVPKWMALRPFIDVFFDPAIDDMQAARLIVYREFITESELKDRERTEGWRKSFITECLKHKGESVFAGNNPLVQQTVTRNRFRQGTLVEDNKNLIEIQHAYYRTHDGHAQAIYCTVFHPSVKDDWGKHEPIDYAHGEYPFDSASCEEEERPIMESRGVPEIVLTWQGETKQVRDYHADRMSLDVLPPLMTPKNQAGQVAMGPAQQIERRRSGDYEFLAIPPMSQTSLLFSKEVEREINEYFGRFSPDADPIMIQAARQELVTDALTDLTPVVTKTFQLAQQYLTDEEIGLICGRAGLEYRAGRADIQGQFDIEFVFDVRTLDTDFIETFGNVMKNIIVPLDRGGTIDFSETVGVLLSSFDPNIAERIQRSGEATRMQDVNDEQNQLAKILAGIEPPMGEQSNPQLRLQILQNAVQSSPTVQKKAQEDPVVQALLENRVKMLKFSLAQMANAETGRVGAEPVLGSGGLPGAGGPPLGVSRLDAAAGAAS